MAGWAAFDAHVDNSSRYHFSSAMRLANEGNDHYWCAYAAYLAGVVNEERGHPDDALKLLQLAQVRLFDAVPNDQRVPRLTAWLHADSAGALINMDRPDAARHRLVRARDAWQPTNPEDAAELDFVCALVAKGLGQLDVAEQFAASAVRHRSGTPDRRAALVERITLAQLYATTGDRAAAPMTQSILTDAESMRSQRVRTNPTRRCTGRPRLHLPRHSASDSYRRRDRAGVKGDRSGVRCALRIMPSTCARRSASRRRRPRRPDRRTSGATRSAPAGSARR